ncbi:MAG TPA: metalloregulator ArsR/SmtB family transcription factor [Asanoa sp.]|nr:metalloregulator ArsR/SmtB family transcription factor [Asanoa sp.]
MKPLPPLAPLPDVFKALSDPMRWTIIQAMGDVDELACTTIEQLLPVSKPTISYHIKVLYHAGLIEIRKQGRNYFYRLRRAALDEVMDELGTYFLNVPQVA